MAYKNPIQRYRRLYAGLLHLYSKSHYERFGEGMEQTFNDLLRGRAEEGKGIFSCALWMFIETSAGIAKERTTIIMQNKNIVRIALITATILLVPLVAMQFTDEVNWGPGDFIIMGGLLLGVSLAYELVARRSKSTVYRVAFGVWLAAAFLLFWMNGAVGIIGNEGQPVNLLYGVVFAVALIGSFMARFRPRGMALTLFAAAFTQMLIPVIAMIVWPDVSWGAAGVVGVFCFNGFFVVLFIISGLLFRRAGATVSK